jgi:CheY-like chemotaxis protein
VVDDNEINQRVLQRQLMAVSSVALEVATASDGRRAVELVLARWPPGHSSSNHSAPGDDLPAVAASPLPPFDAVFMDVEMPIMNGLDATAEIRRCERERGRPPVPILGLSGNARPVRLPMLASRSACRLHGYI